MDFALILFVALIVTGVIWLWDNLVGAPKRQQQLATAGASNIRVSDTKTAPHASDTNPEPIIVEYAKAFFPVILLVFVLRSFVVEPFRIPSGSMLPSLRIGDFILVNKFGYGIRLPILNQKVISTGDPERGEVMVFRFPHNESVNYIKRVVGIPGDQIIYNDKSLTINGERVPLKADGEYPFEEEGKRHIVAQQYEEVLGESDHNILVDPRRRTDNHQITVPEGHYFVMGDNRDYSNDSRYWGFVPEQNIVGKAFFIWFSWDIVNGGGVAWSRIGKTID